MSDEKKLAETIVSVLPQGSVVRFCSDDAESLRFSVQASDLKLRSVVFARASLRRLLCDAARAIKVEYLQRDLLRSAARRAEFRYPRLSRIVQTARQSRLRAARAVAAAAR
jgi:hypothetical protein